LYDGLWEWLVEMRLVLLGEFIQCEFVILGSLVLYFDGADK
jgi:hypothetical protein